MDDDTACRCVEKHYSHLCVLRSKEKSGEIASKTNTPNVVCNKCGEEANSKDNVCLPVQLFV
jgi:hypothetical protein